MTKRSFGGKLRPCLLVLATTFNLLGAGSAYGELKLEEKWRITGLSNPESVAYDAKRDRCYVSNMAGDGLEGKGLGYISVISGNGKLLHKAWVSRLNAPKGMAIQGDTLYVSTLSPQTKTGDNGLLDLSSVVTVINLNTGDILRHIPAPGAHLFNDIAVSTAGHVYVSDMGSNSIYRLEKDRFELWLSSRRLQDPNGLYADGSKLYVASFGVLSDPLTGAYDFNNPHGGTKVIDLLTRELKDFGSSEPVGMLDGIVKSTSNTWFITNKVDGQLQELNAKGAIIDSIKLGGAPADLGYDAQREYVIIPFGTAEVKEGQLSDAVAAYSIIPSQHEQAFQAPQ